MVAAKRKATPNAQAQVRDDNGIRLDLEHRSFYRLSLLATRINRAIASGYVKNFGRPAHAWKVVTVLGAFGPMSASQINSHTTLEMDKVTRIVDSLIEQGLATRNPDPKDRRKVVITLSARGKRVNAQLEQMIVEMEREFLLEAFRGFRQGLEQLLGLAEVSDRLQVRRAPH